MESFHAAIYQNLKFLVQIFPNLDMESKLNEDMFKKPNTKGMHSVFYSLIMILKPEYCQKHVPWPVSFQSDSYKFRSSVIEFIKMECPNFEAPKLLPSLLNKAAGEKYVRLVFDFVTYVTRTILTRENYVVLEIPSSNLDVEESTGLFDRAATTIYNERQSSKNQNKQIMENGVKFIRNSDDERRRLLKRIHNKKESLHGEVNHLNYTNINDKATIDESLLDFEHDLSEAKRNYLILQEDVRRILTKKERLLQLVNLAPKCCCTLIDTKYLESTMTPELASTVNVSLRTIVSSVFINSNVEPLISLNDFMYYGHLLLKSRLQKCLKSKQPEQNNCVCERAKQIVDHVTTKFRKLKDVHEALDKIILEFSHRIPDLKHRFKETSTVNADFVKTIQTIIAMNRYCPRSLALVPEKSLLLETPEKSESNETIVLRMRKIMEKNFSPEGHKTK